MRNKMIGVSLGFMVLGIFLFAYSYTSEKVVKTVDIGIGKIPVESYISRGYLMVPGITILAAATAVFVYLMVVKEK